MEKMILCVDCARRYATENGEPVQMSWAQDGRHHPVDPEDDEMLICSPIEEIPMLRRIEQGVFPMPCDRCRRRVGVSRSSSWFVEERISESILH